MATPLSIYKLVPSQEQLTDLETRVAHILGWQAGTVEVRETIREFRMGKRPYDRYDLNKINRLTEVISPPQTIQPSRLKVGNRFYRIGGK